MTQAANDRGQIPLANFSALTSQKSLADLARRQRLSDVASERAYEQSSAEAASKRRVKEYTEDERLRTVKDLADQGIPVRSNMSMDDLAKAKRDFLTQKAGMQLDVIRSQMDAAHGEQQQAFDTIHRIATTPTLGTKDQRLAALRTALNDPSARLLPDDVRANLHAVLDRGEDPAKAMDQAVQRMQQFWGSKGILKSTRFNNAAQFLQAYTAPLQSSASESQKVDLMAAMKALDDANKQSEALNQQAYAHLGANAAFFPKDTISEWTSKLGPPPNPNDIMSSAMRTNPGQPQDEPPAPMITTPSTAPAPPPAPKSIQQSMNGWSSTGGFAGKQNFDGSGISNPFANIIPDEPSPEESAAVASAAQPVAPGQVQSFKAASTFLNPKSGVGGTVLMPASPQEKTKIETIVRAGLMAKGFNQAQIDQFISDSNQKMASGDPQAISSANQLLNMVRSTAGMPQPTVANQ